MSTHRRGPHTYSGIEYVFMFSFTGCSVDLKFFVHPLKKKLPALPTIIIFEGNWQVTSSHIGTTFFELIEVCKFFSSVRL